MKFPLTRIMSVYHLTSQEVIVSNSSMIAMSLLNT